MQKHNVTIFIAHLLQRLMKVLTAANQAQRDKVKITTINIILIIMSYGVPRLLGSSVSDYSLMKSSSFLSYIMHSSYQTVIVETKLITATCHCYLKQLVLRLLGKGIFPTQSSTVPPTPMMEKYPVKLL